MDKPFAIFDMDGTLVDSMDYWRTLGESFLRSRGVKNIPEDLLERIKPMTITQSSAYFISEFGISGTPESVAAEMNGMMEDHYRYDIPLKKGVKEYLEELHERGVRMCVASATAEHLMEACLKRNGVSRYFEFLLSCESVGAGKDSPAVYFEAARRLGAKPEEAAVYEDAKYAAATARDAGFYVVGVYDESSKKHWQILADISDETVIDFGKSC